MSRNDRDVAVLSPSTTCHPQTTLIRVSTQWWTKILAHHGIGNRKLHKR